MIEKIRENTRLHFWCLLGILLLMIMTRYAFQIDIPRVFFLLVIGLIAIWGDQSEIIAICMCFIPMHESIDFFYALVICCAVYVFKYHKKIRLGTQVVLVLIVVIWELLHCFSTAFSVRLLLVYVIPFIVLAIFMFSNLSDLDYPFIVRALAWSTLAISLMLFIRVLYFSRFNILIALAGLQRLGSDVHSGINDVTVSGGQINPNSLGIIGVLASTGLMQLRAMNASKKVDMVLMCIILVLAALGTSRTYLACLALMIILLVISEKGNIRKKIRLVLALTAAVAVVVVALAVFFPNSFEHFVGRFSVKDITTGRDDLMVKYHNFIVSNPNVMFFGIGLQDWGERLVYHYRVSSNVPHNSIQEIIVAWGLPGLAIFIALFFTVYQLSARRNKNQKLLNWIPLIIILFKSMAGQILTSSYTMLALSFAFLSLCQDFTPNTQLSKPGL